MARFAWRHWEVLRKTLTFGGITLLARQSGEPCSAGRAACPHRYLKILMKDHGSAARSLGAWRRCAGRGADSPKGDREWRYGPLPDWDGDYTSGSTANSRMGWVSNLFSLSCLKLLNLSSKTWHCSAPMLMRDPSRHLIHMQMLWHRRSMKWIQMEYASIFFFKSFQRVMMLLHKLMRGIEEETPLLKPVNSITI